MQVAVDTFNLMGLIMAPMRTLRFVAGIIVLNIAFGDASTCSDANGCIGESCDAHIQQKHDLTCELLEKALACDCSSCAWWVGAMSRHVCYPHVSMIWIFKKLFPSGFANKQNLTFL